MLKRFGLICAGLLIFAPAGMSDEPITVKAQSVETIELGTRYTLQSKILGEERDILVRLPDGYDEGTASYPVVYITDAESHFSYATLMAGVLEQQERIPLSIFVGIPNKSEQTRSRDLGEQKENFRSFLKEEVITFVDRTFRTKNLRTFYGGSMGGGYALELLADHRDIFHNYIAASSGASDDVIQSFESQFSGEAAFDNAVYFTMTERGEEWPEAVEGANNLAELFAEKAPKGLRWRYELIEREVHMTTPIPTIYAGLSHVFRDFQMPTLNSYGEYEANGGMGTLEAHFAIRSAKYGFEAGVPEFMYMRVGELLAADGKFDQALVFLKQRIEVSPESRLAYNGLGSTYDQMGRTEEALAAYNRALSLAKTQNPNAIAYYEGRVAAMEAKLVE